MSDIDIKERIITTTIDLIKKSDGDINSITTRSITNKLGIGVGTINYHFQSKNNLIEICIERIVSNVIINFEFTDKKNYDTKQLLHLVVEQVFEFLFNNYAISRISILGDLKNPKLGNNTIKTMFRFHPYMKHIDIPNQKILVHCLVATMQSAFLNQSISKDMFGYDLSIKKEREKFINDLIQALF